MTKIIIIWASVIFIATLTGCENNESITLHTGDITTFDNVSISVDNGYEFVDFSKEYKDDKCTVIINYNKEVEDD
jgi:hypothetical protein